MKRVVSLVPSTTETLLAWGVTPVAVTRFCDAPGVTAVGGTKNPDTPSILALAPDVVLMDKEENRAEDARVLSDAGLAVVATHVRDLGDVPAALAQIARAAGVEPPPLEPPPLEPSPLEPSPLPSPPLPSPPLAAPPLPPAGPRMRVYVPIWRRPWMAIGAGTYATSLLSAAGFDNVAALPHTEPYPHLGPDEAAGLRPDLVLAPSEPYPFSERHRAELEVAAPVRFVDGRDLFWWGVRTGPALGRLRLLAAGRPGR